MNIFVSEGIPRIATTANHEEYTATELVIQHRLEDNWATMDKEAKGINGAANQCNWTSNHGYL